ncbi:MAG: DUF2586 family protein [Coriobacteriia bacterium]
MNKITIVKGNGGVPQSLPGQDHYSGLIMYLANANLPAGFSTTDRIKAISTLADAEALGIVSTSANWEIIGLHYHISECFRVNPACLLWVGLFLTPTSTYDFTEINQMVSFSEGKMRKCTVWAYQLDLAAQELTTLQGIATALDALFTPVQIAYCPRIANISSLTSLVSTGLRNVSVVIGQDGDGAGAAIYVLTANATNLYSVSLAGLVCGHMSLAKVHESIAWVEKFPSGIPTPAFGDGTLVKNCSAAVITTLDDDHYLFLNYQGGLSGSWWNDSYSMDLDTSDYKYIETNISMDKAIRGIRTYLLPKLSGPIYLQDDGTLRPDDVAYLETLAGKQLEDMKKAKELSGYLVTINPAQNVLSTSEIEFVIQKIGVGVMRKFKVTINNTTNIS